MRYLGEEAWEANRNKVWSSEEKWSLEIYTDATLAKSKKVYDAACQVRSEEDKDGINTRESEEKEEPIRVVRKEVG